MILGSLEVELLLNVLEYVDEASPHTIKSPSLVNKHIHATARQQHDNYGSAANLLTLPTLAKQDPTYLHISLHQKPYAIFASVPYWATAAGK